MLSQITEGKKYWIFYGRKERVTMKNEGEREGETEEGGGGGEEKGEEDEEEEGKELRKLSNTQSYAPQ